jgi:RimJ/RimL family protein N-acetyltransferase
MGLRDPPVVIEGVRLRLRRSTPLDAVATFRAAADAEVMKYLDWPAHRSEADARAYLEGCAQRWQTGTEYHWIVEAKPAGEPVGSIACRVQGHAADFGVLLARDAWGRGYGTQAAELLVGWLKRQGEIVRIWATTDVDNARSLRVLEKLGLQREGVMRKAAVRPQLPGGPRDTALYAWVR